MPTDGKKNVSFKLDVDLHAEVKAFIEEHGMTTGEFMTLAIENELHPKIEVKEDKSMQNSRTMAFQVSEEFFQRLKAYLKRHNITQKDFVVNLVGKELDRDEALYENNSANQEDQEASDGEDEESGQEDEDSGQNDEYGGEDEGSEQSNEYGPTM